MLFCDLSKKDQVLLALVIDVLLQYSLNIIRTGYLGQRLLMPASLQPLWQIFRCKTRVLNSSCLNNVKWVFTFLLFNETFCAQSSDDGCQKQNYTQNLLVIAGLRTAGLAASSVAMQRRCRPLDGQHSIIHRMRTVCNLLTRCLPACLSVCLYVCLPVCLSVCLPVCLPACLSVCQACLSPNNLRNYTRSPVGIKGVFRKLSRTVV
jgi:hypothetical protein